MTNTELLADGYIFRHAFTYADSLCSTDDAARYARYYEGAVRELVEAGEEYHAPSHRERFADWSWSNSVTAI
jgi:hypothetical protein